MNKNKMYGAILSMLLLVPGQVWCSEQPVPQGILDRLMISMPAVPTWMSSFSTNVTNSFSALSDNTKYLIYGTAAALFAYFAYKTKNMFTSGSISTKGPTKIEGTSFFKPNYQELNSVENRSNIAYIVQGYNPYQGNTNKEYLFQHYVCPVLNACQNDLDSKEKWNSFLIAMESNAHGIKMPEGFVNYGCKLFILIKKSCSNDKITTPLKELLIENSSGDERVLELLNQ
jgi:hypothetical protein